MDMRTGETLTDAERYGDEVLNANWLSHPALALGLQTQATQAKHEAALFTDIDGFLARLYSAQE
ncbi:MAG: hypothetical protein QM776_08720 [Rhodocyclaceae bacterium]